MIQEKILKNRCKVFEAWLLSDADIQINPLLGKLYN